MRDLYEKIKADPRLQENLKKGRPRPGHPEGTVGAHVQMVEANIEKMRPFAGEDMYWKLKVLAIAHDSFKAEATRGSRIEDPQSHSSLAVKYLKEQGVEDYALLATCQWHDEPFALWRKQQKSGLDQARFDRLVARITDWDLFLAFQMADNLTPGKDEGPTEWFFKVVEGKIHTKVSMAWMGPSGDGAGDPGAGPEKKTK